MGEGWGFGARARMIKYSGKLSPSAPLTFGTSDVLLEKSTCAGCIYLLQSVVGNHTEDEEDN